MSTRTKTHDEARVAIDEAQRRRELQRAEDLRTVLATDAGLRLLAWVVYELGGLENGTFNPSIKGDSTLHTHHAEGRRDLAIDVRNAIVRASPRYAVELLAERIRAEQADLELEEQLASAGEAE